MNLTVKEVLEIPHVAERNILPLLQKEIRGVSTDSRTTAEGDIFFAIKGEKYDGHAYLHDSYLRGALVAVVVHSWFTPPRDPVIVVADTKKALGDFARLYRRKFEIPVIAVGGSNGKTTTKEMIAGVLGGKFRTLSTKGNLNNDIGVPQTLFQLTPKHQAAVIEIGTNHFGEISYLADVLEPTHGLITNIGREHLEFFGDLDGVERAEIELFQYLEASKGTGFVNLDDERIAAHAKLLKKKTTYSWNSKTASVQGTIVSVDSQGRCTFTFSKKASRATTVQLQVPGLHVAQNALAAATVGLEFGVPAVRIKEALEEFVAVRKRMEVLQVGGVTIINDTYNANPDSVISALRTLDAMATDGKKYAVLADMLELGENSRAEHQNVGASLTGMKINGIFTYGDMAKHFLDKAPRSMKRHTQKKATLLKFLQDNVRPGDAVLVKGSRGMMMEEVVQGLAEILRGDPPSFDIDED
jgi:UDP-N-acetylmuramoyl-tripeptide--D-alanyl-D-alanine ligase